MLKDWIKINNCMQVHIVIDEVYIVYYTKLVNGVQNRCNEN